MAMRSIPWDVQGEWVARVLRLIGPGATVLDAPCGDGQVLSDASCGRCPGRGH